MNNNNSTISRETIEYIINILAGVFPDIIYNINKFRQNNDPYSYYLFGHCTSFAKILYQIFNNDALIFYSQDHTLVKIQDDYYDIRGCITKQINPKEFKECPIDYFPFIEEIYGNVDSVDDEITTQLINIGLKELQKKLARDEQLVLRLS